MRLKNLIEKLSRKINEEIFFLKYPEVRKHDLFLHPIGEFVSDEIRKCKKYYELDLLIYIKNNYNCDRFCDIGANIGNHSSFFSKLGSVGWAFEPSKKNFELLKKMLQILMYLTLHYLIKQELRSLLHMKIAVGTQI